MLKIGEVRNTHVGELGESLIRLLSGEGDGRRTLHVGIELCMGMTSSAQSNPEFKEAPIISQAGDHD